MPPRRRRTAYQRLLAELDGRTREAARRLIAGDLDAGGFGAELEDAVYDGHRRAYLLGIAASGGDPGSDETQALADEVAASIRDLESYYIRGYELDLEQLAGSVTDPAGELSEAKIRVRNRLYLAKTRGTQAAGWVDAGPEDALYEWRLGGSEENCDECPVLAEQGPYLRDELPTTPGAGMTPCLSNCKCRLVRDDSELSEPPVDWSDYDDETD